MKVWRAAVAHGDLQDDQHDPAAGPSQGGTPEAPGPGHTHRCRSLWR